MRVLLVEDDDMIGDSVRKGLRHDGFAIDWVRDGEAAVQAVIAPGAAGADGAQPAGTSMFDLMLLDLGLPKRDGLEVVREVRQRGIAIPILILTARDAVADRVAGLNAGADDYLVKPFDLQELAARMHALLRRQGGRADPLMRHGEVLLNPVTREVLRAGLPVKLSGREFAVLHALLARPGKDGRSRSCRTTSTAGMRRSAATRWRSTSTRCARSWAATSSRTSAAWGM